MLKALVKKQLRELLALTANGSKSGSRVVKLLLPMLFVYIFGAMGFTVYMMMEAIAAPMLSLGAGWAVFSLGGLYALTMSVFFGMLAAKAQLYDAKDNELLLAMPIKPSILLASRLIEIGLITAITVLTVLLPTLIAYIAAGGGYEAIAAFPLSFLLVTLSATAISCLVGRLISLISARVRRKGLVTVILTVGFLLLYFYGYSLIMSRAGELLASPERIVGMMALFKFAGLAAEGEILPLAAMTLIVALISIVSFKLIESGFFAGLAESGRVEVVTVEVEYRARSVRAALLKRELSGLLGCPIYLINCSLGLIMMPIALIAR